MQGEHQNFYIYFMENTYTEIAYIYILIDPRDNQTRYVGKTINPLNRLNQHISECKNIKVLHHRAKWIRKLSGLKLLPIIKFIKICNLLDFEKYEAEYIKLYKSDKLTNSDESGSGNTGRIKEVLDRQSKTAGRIVYQYDLNGNFIEEYQSVRTAANALKISHSNISRSCNKIVKHASGFIFRYNKEIVNRIDEPNAMKKLVIEVNILGHEVGRWLSIMDCTRNIGIDNGNISRVCNGKQKSIKGRYFKFLLTNDTIIS